MTHWMLLLSVAVPGATQIILVFGLFGWTRIWEPGGLVMKTTRVMLFAAVFASIHSILIRRRDALPLN